MSLVQFIRRAFPEGLSYNEVAQLCLRLYCSTDGVPEAMHMECSKDGLAEAFSQLASQGFVTSPPLTAAFYGANFHAVAEKGHWIEVIASIFKKGDTVDAGGWQPVGGSVVPLQVMKPNNAINADDHEQCAFVASLTAAGYGGRWAE